MELTTATFGRVTYEFHQVLDIRGLRPSASEWLLLADKAHPDLYWLQSVTDASQALPVRSIAGMMEVRVPIDQCLPGWTGQTPLIGLAEIRREEQTVSLELSRPILIDPHARRGIRLLADEDQTLQHAPSDKVAPLRECA